MDGLIADLRFSLRTLSRTPGFSAVAVATLALGIGANAAVFSVVQGVLLRPLPWAEPEELALVREVDDEGSPMWPSYQNFVDWRDQSEGLERMVAITFPGTVTVLGGVEPARARGVLVTRGFFELLGVSPARGRPLVAADHEAGAATVAVVSHRFWREVLGAPEDLTDVTVTAGGALHRVVGVMSPDFEFLREADLWSALEPTGRVSVRGAHWLQVVGRTAKDVDLTGAEAELDRIASRLAVEHAGQTDAVGVTLVPLREVVLGDARRPLLMLMGAAGMVLLVACANLASTLLARGSRRREELAVRSALGASRARIVRQLFTETLLLTGAGTGLGVLAALALVRSLLAGVPEGIPRIDEVGVDASVLAFAGGVALLASLLFGLLPALRVSSGRASAAGVSGRSAGRRGTTRLWRLLVGVETALAVMLLVGAGLLIRSLWNVVNADVGYDPTGVVVAELSLPPSRYDTSESMAAFFKELVEAARAVPGVQEAGIGSWLPADLGAYSAPVELPDGSRTDPGIGYRVADRGYFGALDIPLLRGRLFDATDTPSSPDVAVVNETLARRLFPGEDALGKRFRVTGMDAYGDRWLTVVGVVGEARHWSAPAGTQAEYYVSVWQRPFIAARLRAVLTVESAVSTEALIPPLRAAIHDIDPDVPAELATLRQRLDRSVADRRFTLVVLTAFAGLALVLSAVGIYGVVSWSVAARTREIGIRMALGATPSAVLGAALGRSTLTAGAGALAGILGALSLQRVIRSLLFEVEPADPLTLAGSVGLLAATAAMAAWIPARRATRIDPVETLRTQ